MKTKFLMLLFIGITSVYGQKAKKANSVKPSLKTTTTAPKVVSKEGMFVEFETTKGKIIIQLEYQKAPITVGNFVALVEGKNPFVKDEFKGKPFYDGLKFHRVIKDFMIQGGDPLGNGSGGPGFAFKDEIVPEFKFDKGGILAMANSGPATNGSQFFITHKETSWLNGKHTIFGYITSGMDVVNAIAQDDVMQKVTIKRVGAAAKAFDAVKTFSNYYANKGEDDKKQAAIEAESKRKQAEADAAKKKEYVEKYGSVMAAKVVSFNEIKATANKTTSGLQYKIIKNGTGKKPIDGTTIYFHYAGYLEDGSLFDSSYEDVNKAYGKFDANRASQNGYQPFPFQFGKKDGLIPGFIEGLNFMGIGDKIVLFIPAALGYGERGAGNVIPPNANIIFEVEMFETK